MEKPKGRIYIKGWLELKPYENQVPTDTYYLDISNKVKQVILKNKYAFTLNIYLDNEYVDVLACFLTSYFEDLVSETNIWSTFIRCHAEEYKKQLPFYDLDEYYDDEINYQDICFLIWYFLNTVQLDKFISPFNDFILELSKGIFEVFEDEWEYAPENEKLQEFYSIDEATTDYYHARQLIDNLLYRTYLFYPDTLLRLRDTEQEILEEYGDDDNIHGFLGSNRDESLYNKYTRLLGKKGQEWVGHILGGTHKLSKYYFDLSPKITGYFLYKGQDEENVFLEHIASGKKFNMTKKSFDHGSRLHSTDTILIIGIINWMGEWWFSGSYAQMEFDADLVTKEKNSLESRSAVNFLDHKEQERDIEEILDIQQKAFLEFNQNKPIAFLDSNRIESFTKSYHEYYNNFLSLSDKERRKSKDRAKKEGWGEQKDEPIDFSEVSESGLVFFNPKSGVEIGLAINSAFPTKDNPYFNKKESEEHIIRLLSHEELSTELTMYCVKNFKDKLPFFKTPEGRFYLENLDFLLRFWKGGNYYTKPSITLVGTKK